MGHPTPLLRALGGKTGSAISDTTQEARRAEGASSALDCILTKPRLAGGDRIDVELWAMTPYKGLEERKDLADLRLCLLNVLRVELLRRRERPLEVT